MELTETEKQLIMAIRELRPFQELIISKDKGGRLDRIYITDARQYILGVGFKKLFDTNEKII